MEASTKTASSRLPRHTFSGIIDVHSHPILNIGADTPLDKQPEWSIEKTLSLMDAHDIAVCILSVPDAANHAEGKEASRIARRVNEKLAEIVALHPDRFGAMATLPGRTMDGALSEMEYALDTLHMDGIATATSINDVYLGDPQFDVWFEEMNRRSVTLFVHPTIAKASIAVGLGINVAMLEFMFDTTRMLTNMVFSGAKSRFSNIRMISTHGGGTIPYLVSRLQTLEIVFGPGHNRRQLSAEEIKEGLASFYYDLTACTSQAQIAAIIELVSTSQLLMGFDIPYMPEWSFRPAAIYLAQWKGFTQDDLNQIAHKNARLLYPNLADRMVNQQ